MGRAQSGDGQAYGELLADVASMLRRYLAKHIHDAQDVEDVLQETLLAIHRGRHTYDPRRPLEPWLFAIARNAKIDYVRRTLSRQSWEVLVDEQPEAPAESEGQDAALVEAMAELPENQRAAFRRLKLEGRSVAEAAAIEGISEGNLRVRAHRAYKTLKNILSR